jgi:Zn-dependent metalloprotease
MNNFISSVLTRSFQAFCVCFFINTIAYAQQKTSDPGVQSIERNKIDNTPASIYFSPAANWSTDQAGELFSKYLGISGNDNAMILTSTNRTRNNIGVKRYYQYYKGVKVEYGSVALTCKEGRVSFLTGNIYNPDPALSPVPAITEKAALGKALNFVGAEKYMWQNPKQEERIKKLYHKNDTSYFPHGRLVWIEDYSNGMTTNRELHLAYKFDIYAEKPLSRQEVFIDANTGRQLFSNNLIKHTAASGHSLYSGVVPFQTSFVGGTYILYDSTRGSGIYTVNMNNGTDYTAANDFSSPTNLWPTATPDSAALDAQWGCEKVYDFWKTLGRNSWDDLDGILVSYIHYDVGYNNAFWDGAEMTYGDGSGCGGGFTSLVALDVTGHEIGHGVCQATANLVYASESGAMNEGFSDCWGASIENWANPFESDAVAKSVWAIGEEVGCGNPLRRMDFPKLKGDPDTYGGTNWVTVLGCTPSSGNDECGVHTNSGVLNKWYFLITAGGSGTNDIGSAYVVTGLGFTKSQDILYQTELALASTADYALCRTTSINAALALYGPCSPEVQTVTNAWYAVGVGSAFTPCVPNIGFTSYSMSISENAATTSCPASKVYTIGLKPYGPAFTGGNPTVTVFAARGNAVAGTDYTLSSTILTFPVGSTTTQYASITVFDNGAVHDDKNLVLGYTLAANGSNATRSTTNDSLFINISNDDSIPDPGHPEYHTLNIGSTVTSNLTSAFPGANSREHSQFLLYASEMAAAGVKPGVPISQIAFNITTKNSTSPFVGYTMSMGNSTFIDMSSIFATGLTQVYTGTHTTNVGIDSLDFNTSTFTWDGTSNVIVEICFGKNATAAGNDQMDGISGSYIVCDHNGTTSGSGTGCSLPYSTGSLDASTARPVMRFKQVVPPTPIETAAASTHTWDVKAGQEVYFYNTSDGKAMAGLKNISNNLGCVTATVTQSGVGFTPAAFSPINRSLKEFSITPTINGSTTTYDAIIYLTNTELAGVTPSSLYLIKTDALTDATVSTSNSVELTPVLIPGTNYVGFKGTFTGFSRFFLVDGPICDKPSPVITPAGPLTFCSGGSVLLNANIGAGLTYQWQLAGSDIPGATNNNYTASLAGNYTLKEFSGACNNVSSSVAVAYTVVTAGSITGLSGVCTGQTTTLSDAVTSGVWTSANTSLATVGSSSGIVTGITPGVVTIDYTITNPCGTATTTKTLTVSNPPVVAPISGNMSVCAGASTSLSDATPSGTWNSGNTSLATVSSSGLVSGLSAGAVPISYSVTGIPGCVARATATVTVNALPAAAITPLGSPVLCAGGGSVVLNATSGAGLTYQWKLGGGDITGATTSSYTASSAGSYSVLITNSNNCSAVSAPVAVTISGAIVVPSVSIVAGLGTVICVAGSSETYNAIPVNGGSFPAYQWYVNGIPSSSGIPFTYVPANGDIIKCRLTSSDLCATPDTAIANIVMSVGTYQTPSVSITASPGNSICAGTSATFLPLPVYGGASPTYQWTKNGLNVSSLPSFTYIPANGDIIACIMTSDYTCVTSPTATSNSLTMDVVPVTTNLDTIRVTQTKIASGQIDTFVAFAPYAGTTPSYQWYLNNAPVPGATNATYITTSLSDGDKIKCQVTSSNVCAVPNINFSNTIKIQVTTGIDNKVAAGDLILIPNPNKGEFTISGSLTNTADVQVSIIITNVLGQTIYEATAQARNGEISERITLPSAVPNGIYLVKISSGENPNVFRIVVDR